MPITHPARAKIITPFLNFSQRFFQKPAAKISKTSNPKIPKPKKRKGDYMNDTAIKISGNDRIDDFIFDEAADASAKKIGQTIYVASLRFNGDTNWDMTAALVRLIEQEALVPAE